MYNQQPFYWITPNDSILPDAPQNNPGMIYTGDSIADFITAVGSTALVVNVENA